MLLKKDVYKRNVAVRIDAVVFGFGYIALSACRLWPDTFATAPARFPCARAVAWYHSALNQLRERKTCLSTAKRLTKLDNRLGLRRTDASRVDRRQLRFGLFEGIGPLRPYPPRQASSPDYAFAERMSWWVFLFPITQRSNGRGLRMSDTAFADTAPVIPTSEEQAPERLLSETEVLLSAWDAGLEPHHFRPCPP